MFLNRNRYGVTLFEYADIGTLDSIHLGQLSTELLTAVENYFIK